MVRGEGRRIGKRKGRRVWLKVNNANGEVGFFSFLGCLFFFIFKPGELLLSQILELRNFADWSKNGNKNIDVSRAPAKTSSSSVASSPALSFSPSSLSKSARELCRFVHCKFHLLFISPSSSKVQRSNSQSFDLFESNHRDRTVKITTLQPRVKR